MASDTKKIALNNRLERPTGIKAGLILAKGDLPGGSAETFA